MELDGMPERIWANPDAGYCTTVGPNTYTTEYIRADLSAPPSSPVSELVDVFERFDMDPGGFLGERGSMEQDPTGDWVRYSDAVNALSAQKAVVADKNSALQTLSTRNAELEAEIARLRDRVAELEKALEPFADIADLIDSETEGMSETDELALHFHDYLMASWPVALFRAARRVREGGKVDG